MHTVFKMNSLLVSIVHFVFLFAILCSVSIPAESVSVTTTAEPQSVTLGNPEFRCDYTYFAGVGGFLKLHEKPATWMKAKSLCYYEGAKLFTPQEATSRDLITNLMSRYSKKEIFTDVSSTNSGGYYFDLKGKPFIPYKWAVGEPYSESEETCVTFLQDGTFADTSCDKKKPYVCFKAYKNEIPNECGTIDNEYILNDATGKCYKFHKLSKKWKEAHLICAAEGSNLAIVNSDQESSAISNIYSRHPTGTLRISEPQWESVAFVGFRFDNSTDRYETLDGQTLEEAGFDTFHPGNPNSPVPGDLCGGIYRSGLLDDTDCQQDHAFICEREPGYQCRNQIDLF